MRKKNQEITDPSVIEEILGSSEICRVGMTDQGRPYILPFNYGYRSKDIFIHCAKEGKKIDLIRKNPEVCFEIEHTARILQGDTACKWSTLYRSVIGYGRIRILSGTSEKKEGLDIIMAHNGAKGPCRYESAQVNAVLVLKLTIEKMTAKQSGNWHRVLDGRTNRFESENLQFREITWEDLAFLHALHSMPEIDEFNTLGIPGSLHETREVIRPFVDDRTAPFRKNILWTIRQKNSDRLIGEAGMKLSADRFKMGEIYYNLAPEHWNQGFGTETAKRLIRFGFEEMGLHKVEAGVATGNLRSVRVLEKAGMTREGLRRKVLPIRGDWKDNYHYSILDTDPRAG